MGDGSTRIVSTPRLRYVTALSEVEKMNGSIVDLPAAIHELLATQGSSEAFRQSLDTLTGEYHGIRDGMSTYEICHGVGPLATASRLQHLYNLTYISEGDWRQNLECHVAKLHKESAFVEIPAAEWNQRRSSGALFHLDDLRSGKVPLGQPYSLFVRVGKDKFNINDKSRFDFTSFMQDDRVLMLVGSVENREKLARLLFSEDAKGDHKKHSGVYAINRIAKFGFTPVPKGRLLRLTYFITKDTVLFDIAPYDICGYGRFGIVQESSKLP